MNILRRLAVAAAVLLCAVLCAVPALAEESTGAIGGASFRVEQAYVNVPEMDIFLYATDQTGASVSPTMLKAAGVELKLGDRTVPTGIIGQAAEPICYLVVVDNNEKLDSETFALYKKVVRQIAKHKGENDQIVLFASGSGQCVMGAAEDAHAVTNGLKALQQEKSSMDMAAAATGVYKYVNENFQSLAPRKVILAFTHSEQLLANLALVAGISSGATEQLNMDLNIYVTAEHPELFASLTSMAKDRVTAVEPEALGAAVLSKMDSLATALEIKTELPEDTYGEKMEKLTLSVPKLGSAVTSTSTVYMGHRLTKPAVTGVEVVSRNQLQVTFNQAVENAERPGSYRITSEDIWNFRVPISQVELAQDGRTALLTTGEELYEGNYGVRLNKVTSRLTAANISDFGVETLFSVQDWPRDKGFYMARFRLPVLVLGTLLLVLVVLLFTGRRKDRSAERAAEAEHLLAEQVGEGALPRRWVTLFIRSRRSIAENRWSGVVESSMLLGSDAAQCDLCLPDKRVKPQHCVLAVEGESLLVCPIGEASVTVNGERIAGEHRLQNNDTIGLGRTTIQLVL